MEYLDDARDVSDDELLIKYDGEHTPEAVLYYLQNLYGSYQ